MASLTQFSVSALGTASVRIVELVLKTNRTELIQSSQFMNLETQARLFSSGYNKMEVSLYTEEIVVGDKRRDNAVSAIYNHVRSLLNAPIPEMQQAARRIYSVLKAHGTATVITGMKLGDESQAVRKLLANIAAEVSAADIATLGLKPWIDELITAQDAFEIIYTRRSDSNASEADIVSATSQRRNLERAIRGLVKYVDAMATVSPEPFWHDLNNRIEERLDELDRAVRASNSESNTESKGYFF